MENKVQSAFNKFISTYERWLVENSEHKRLCQAMKNMYRHYSDIVSTLHSGDIQHVVGSFYRDFLCSVTYIIDNNPDYPCIQDELSKALEKFRHLFGAFLFDILRSDHSFFEVPSTAHPSIGSTTKLLLAYNNIINDWNSNIGVKKGHHRISFLVTSGGCDITQLHNLLYKLEDCIPTKIDKDSCVLYSLPVIITIPEASLYDIKGTLFRLSHEFFHLKGEKYREERFKHFYKGLFYEYIDYCCNYIAKHKNLIITSNTETVEAKAASSITKSEDGDIIISSNDFIKIVNTPTAQLKYSAIKSLMNEFENNIDLSERELKSYLKIIEEAFGAGVFLHSYGLIRFNNELYKINMNNYTDNNVEELRLSFQKNFYAEIGKQKVIDEFYNKIFNLVSKAFDQYDQSQDKSVLLQNLKNIFRLLPKDAISYASRSYTYVPFLIGELSDIYAKIEYEKQSSKREKSMSDKGLVFMSYDGGKDIYNIFGYEEYSDDMGGGIKNLPPLADTYARLWIKASIEFFTTDHKYDFKANSISLSMENYSYRLCLLYKECFADVCALKSYKQFILSNCSNVSKDLNTELISFYFSAFIFENRNVKKLFYIDDGSLDLYLVFRITVTIACVTDTSSTGDIIFNEREVASGIIRKIGSVLFQGVGKEDKDDHSKAENSKILKIKKELSKISTILKNIKEYYNGCENEYGICGAKNYIYIRELVDYLKGVSNISGKDGCENLVRYPTLFNDDYDNIELILEKWLNNYVT